METQFWGKSKTNGSLEISERKRRDREANTTLQTGSFLPRPESGVISQIVVPYHNPNNAKGTYEIFTTTELVEYITHKHTFISYSQNIQQSSEKSLLPQVIGQDTATSSRNLSYLNKRTTDFEYGCTM